MMGVAVAPTELANVRVLSPEAWLELMILLSLTKHNSMNQRIIQKTAAQPCVVVVKATKHSDALHMKLWQDSNS